MKKDIHPNYRPVVFLDTSSDYSFLTRSTVETESTIKWKDGKTYPLVKLEISSASHPFYTGKKIFVDTAGRVDKFNRRYKQRQQASVAPKADKEASKEKPDAVASSEDS